MISILLTVLVLSLIMLGRNQMVYNYSIKALNETSRKARSAIEAEDDWRKYYDAYESYPSYYAMLLDLRKWRYKQFYPGM